MFPTVDAEEISQVTSLNRNSSPSRDVQQSNENNQVAKQNNNRELTLTMLIKEIIFCIALALTTYGALHNTPTKISKHPQAVRFFSPHSVVTDWYRGQLGQALTYVNNADVSFVMYYAPWDAESQYVRGEFEKAANVMSDWVHFSAINCWNPGSECRLQHSKIPSWPILMVYTVNSRGVLYKGPRDAHSLVRFLELIIWPMDRISSTEDLVNLLSTCDAVAVGFTPTTETSKYYTTWYNVALKTREFDVLGETCFAVVTSEELAAELGVDSVPSAQLMLWNDTKEYKLDEFGLSSWNESALLQWVVEGFTQPVARVIPMWKKAFSFEKFVDGSPLLMLFTPLNPLYDQIPFYALMREVAMEYYNCKNNETNQWITELIKLQQVQRLIYQQKDYLQFCQEYKFKKPVVKQNRLFKREIISQNNKYPWSNSTHKSQKTGLFSYLVKRGIAMSRIVQGSEDADFLSPLGLLDECGTKTLPAEKSYYDSYEKCQSQESFDYKPEEEIPEQLYERDTETSMLPLEDDPLSSENLIQAKVKHFCRIVRFAHEWGPVITPKRENNVTSVQGLACAKNFTLNMVAVDSVQNHHFAESLGIDVLNRKDKTAVVILDAKHETQYVLSEEYTASSVRDFIRNFTHKRLKRSLRTHVDEAAHTHYFGSAGDARGVHEGAVEVVDLTTRMFRRFIRTPDTVSLVAVCGGACGAHVTRALSSASRLLSQCGVRARAARVDALRHDLPWEYTAENYPAVIVFNTQRGRDPDSLSYPAHARVSASGLVALALRSLGAQHHLRIRLMLCAKSKAIVEKKTCLNDLKEHVTTVIGRNLKYWRRTEDKRLKDAFLKRLQYLHRVSLDLSLLHVKDISETSKTYISLINSLNTLSSNWIIDVSLLKKSNSVTDRS